MTNVELQRKNLSKENQQNDERTVRMSPKSWQILREIYLKKELPNKNSQVVDNEKINS